MPSDQSNFAGIDDGGSRPSAVSRELTAAGEALHDARDAVKDKATNVASQLQEAATEKAEGLQQGLAESLATFVGALRAAGDHLGESDQPQAAKMVDGAIGAVEKLAGSLRDKPFADVVSDVRSYGENNPGALLAGSILAGLALGRFLKSSAPDTAAGSAPSGVSGHADRPESFTDKPSESIGMPAASGREATYE